MGLFFIETSSGEVATLHQLVDRGVELHEGRPAAPWLRIRGSDDASTLWYAVLRKRERGVYIGTLALRHGGHHASLLASGWEEVPPEEIGPVSRHPFEGIS